MGLKFWALWGLLGAFMYAAPRLVVLLGRPDINRWVSGLEFGITLAIGPIAAAGFGPFVADLFRQSALPGARAIAVVIGMVANPVAPLVVNMASDHVLRRLGAPLKKETKL